MKVKIFNGTPSSVETKINEFFAELGETIEVKSLTQSESNSAKFNLTGTIFYLVAH